jgi:hypothetical protein
MKYKIVFLILALTQANLICTTRTVMAEADLV